MMEQLYKHRKLVINCIGPLLLSLAIYTLFRSENTIVNRLLFNHAPKKPWLTAPQELHWMIYNLPGALWLYAFSFFTITCDRRIWTGIAPLLLALCIELFQWLHITDGTFDRLDVAFYFLAWGLCFVNSVLVPLANGSDALALKLPVKRRFVYTFFVCIVLLSDVWA